MTTYHQPMTHDYLLIGQGLAGTLVADALLRRGRSVLVVDDGHRSSSSMVAAGNVNPISGQRFTVSERFADSEPAARTVYRGIEEQLGIRLLDQRNVVRVFRSEAERSLWERRMGRPALQFIDWEIVERGGLEEAIRADYGALIIRGAFQVRLGNLLRGFRARLREEGALMKASFNPAGLSVTSSGVRYGGVRAQRAVFCEGLRMQQNPLWRSVELRPVKGEALEVRIPGLGTDRVIQRGINVVPIGEDRFWVGATVAREFADLRPTPAARRGLQSELEAALNAPYDVVRQAAGARPASRRRRPSVGCHPRSDRLALLNGLGSKGVLWGPMCAEGLVAYLEDGRPLDPWFEPLCPCPK